MKHSAIERYMATRQLRREPERQRLARAHYRKANETLTFCRAIERLLPEHPSWIIISAYYTAYHCALALLAANGYSSKSHTATIVALKELYPFSVKSVATLEHLSEAAIENLETLKELRETANYSVNVTYELIVAKELRLKAEEFLLETKELLRF